MAAQKSARASGGGGFVPIPILPLHLLGRRLDRIVKPILKTVPGVEQAGEQGQFDNLFFAEYLFHRGKSDIIARSGILGEGRRPADDRLFFMAK